MCATNVHLAPIVGLSLQRSKPRELLSALPAPRLCGGAGNAQRSSHGLLKGPIICIGADLTFRKKRPPPSTQIIACNFSELKPTY